MLVDELMILVADWLSDRRGACMRGVALAAVVFLLQCPSSATPESPAAAQQDDESSAAAQQGDSEIGNASQKKIKKATLLGLQEDPGQIGSLLADSVELGAPKKIKRLGGSAYFFRVPIIHKQSGRQIAYTDLKEQKDGKLKIVRRSVAKIAAEDAIVKLPLDTLELTRDQVVSKAGAIVGKDAKPLKPPTLIYDKSETRVGWVVTMSAGGSKETTVVVTPRYTYEPTVRITTGFRGAN